MGLSPLYPRSHVCHLSAKPYRLHMGKCIAPSTCMCEHVRTTVSVAAAVLFEDGPVCILAFSGAGVLLQKGALSAVVGVCSLFTWTHKHTHMCMHVSTYVCIFVMYICMHAYVHYKYTYVCTHMHTHVCMFVCPGEQAADTYHCGQGSLLQQDPSPREGQYADGTILKQDSSSNRHCSTYMFTHAGGGSNALAHV